MANLYPRPSSPQAAPNWLKPFGPFIKYALTAAAGALAAYLERYFDVVPEVVKGLGF